MGEKGDYGEPGHQGESPLFPLAVFAVVVSLPFTFKALLYLTEHAP